MDGSMFTNSATQLFLDRKRSLMITPTISHNSVCNGDNTYWITHCTLRNQTSYPDTMVHSHNLCYRNELKILCKMDENMINKQIF